MRELNDIEVGQISGGFVNFIFGSAIGLLTYLANKKMHNEPITIPGAVTVTSFGAVTGGLGGAAVTAAGGGVAANLAWRPGFAAINAAGQAFTRNSLNLGAAPSERIPRSARVSA